MFTPNKNLTAKYTKGKSINTVLAFGADNNFFVAKASATNNIPNTAHKAAYFKFAFLYLPWFTS